VVGRLAVGAACHHRRGRHRLRRPGPPDRGGSRLELPEGRLHLLSAYLVVPLFALANAGVVLDAAGLSAAWGSWVAWGGRRAAGRRRRGQPGRHAAGVGVVARGHDRAAPVGAGALAGIGFTVALFVTELAYGSVPSIGVDPAKLAILAASLVAGFPGAAVLLGARTSAAS
jgi:Na+:H+ antiporter, NhaA family